MHDSGHPHFCAGERDFSGERKEGEDSGQTSIHDQVMHHTGLRESRTLAGVSETMPHKTET